MKMSKQDKLTREYVRLTKRIAILEEKAREIKDTVMIEFPEGVKTPYGIWQTYAEGKRATFSAKPMHAIIEKLILEGNATIAQQILEAKTEHTTSGGVRFKAVEQVD